MGLTEWGLGRTLVRVGVCLVAIPDLFWEMDPRSDSRMMCGAEKCPSRKLSQVCMTACDKNSLVAAHLILKSGSFQWDVRFIRAAHDWEVDILASFFTLLYSICIDRDGEDKLWWSPACK